MTDNALTIYQQFGQIQQAAAALYKSGYFQDATSEAQAIVKVMAGAELGLPPFASMAGINIQGGKPVLGGNLIATLIKNDPRYDYRVRTLTDTACAIEFYEHGKPAGVSTFTIEDARKAKVWSKKTGGFIPLTQHNQNWESYPRNMLFNRAISNGAKWYCPGVFGGAPVYTPEEMGLETDEDGVIIEGDFATSAGNTQPEPTGGNNQPPPAESGKAADGHRIADLRAALESNPQPTLSSVASSAAATGVYSHANYALQAMKEFAFPDGVKVIGSQKVSRDGALKIFDWLMARKGVGDDADDDADDDRALHEEVSHPGHPSNYGYN